MHIISKAVLAAVVVLVALGILAGISAFIAWLFWLGWGFVAVPAFGAPALTFTQTWAGMFLLSIIGNYFRSPQRGAK